MVTYIRLQMCIYILNAKDIFPIEQLYDRTEKDKDAMKRDADDARASMDALARDKVREMVALYLYHAQLQTLM